MAIKKVNIRKDSQGFAHILIILAAVLVVGGVGGFAYWRISSYNDNSDASNGRPANASGSNAASSDANSATLSPECVAQTGDPNICRLGAISDLSNYTSEVHMTMVGEGGSMTSVIRYDGKGNHTVDAGNDIKGISVGGKYYVYITDKWYDSGNDSSQAPKSNVPSFGFATTAGIKYENLGKEPCGDKTCFKYKMTGGILADGVVTATFGDQDYLPRRIDSVGGLLSTLTMTVEYKDITITAPEGALPISALSESFGQ